MYPATVLVSIQSQSIQVHAVVFVSEKTGLSVIAALDQMKRNIRKREPGAAWHNCSLRGLL
ncbi:hypothetical protein RP726_02870 [Candidatus Methylospira mobilis]|uniref:hypothetical protein n=1 Tax=Candidatus Methylospira mobilis TaxID=1808979 RepID=UPI0028EDBA55|nr:hypothetical protein [Candidatus Methylospira mobilis]WNV05364.1 hypothetical protein RP726_02870 [Candidatus Methylospira mobilis]